MLTCRLPGSVVFDQQFDCGFTRVYATKEQTNSFVLIIIIITTKPFKMRYLKNTFQNCSHLMRLINAYIPCPYTWSRAASLLVSQCYTTWWLLVNKTLRVADEGHQAAQQVLEDKQLTASCSDQHWRSSRYARHVKLSTLSTRFSVFDFVSAAN